MAQQQQSQMVKPAKIGYSLDAASSKNPTGAYKVPKLLPKKTPTKKPKSKPAIIKSKSSKSPTYHQVEKSVRKTMGY